MLTAIQMLQVQRTRKTWNDLLTAFRTEGRSLSHLALSEA